MSDLNYKCSVVKIDNLSPHPNADKLQLTQIFGNTVIVGLDAKIGDKGLFFPLESQIGEEFAKANDLIRRKDAEGKPAGGMFDANRRVRAMKLRGTPSMGFFCPLHFLDNVFNIADYGIDNCREGDSFNELDGIVISIKYIPKTNAVRNGNPGGSAPKRKPTRYISEQFKEHFDTEHLFKNIHKIPEKSLVIITWKLHGTSLRCGNVLVKRPLTLLEKLCKFFGGKVQETEYDLIAGSRTVIKDPKINPTPGWYKTDVWSDVTNSLFKDKLHKGEMVYAEIVGYLPGSESLIQKGYTYGCERGKCEVYVYRITNTNLDGVSVDLSWEAVKNRCAELGVKHVPESQGNSMNPLGYSSFIWNFSEVNPEETCNWFKRQYLELSELLQPDMPSEGICLRVEGLNPSIYKAKSFRFLELETKQLDQEEVTIEDNA